MKCHEMRDLLGAYLDGEISQQAKKEIYDHLVTCDACGREYQELLRINELARHVPTPEPGPVYWKSLPHRVTKRLNFRPRFAPVLGFKFWSLSFRWVGVAATCVILFFVVKNVYWKTGEPVPMAAHQDQFIVERAPLNNREIEKLAKNKLRARSSETVQRPAGLEVAPASPAREQKGGISSPNQDESGYEQEKSLQPSHPVEQHFIIIPESIREKKADGVGVKVRSQRRDSSVKADADYMASAAGVRKPASPVITGIAQEDMIQDDKRQTRSNITTLSGLADTLQILQNLINSYEQQQKTAIAKSKEVKNEGSEKKSFQEQAAFQSDYIRTIARSYHELVHLRHVQQMQPEAIKFYIRHRSNLSDLLGPLTYQKMLQEISSN
jgi:hypothetical protein